MNSAPGNLYKSGPIALVGYTGFVGGNIAVQHRFDDLYNSKNIADIAGKSYEVLVVSAMPAAMWIANKDPDGDRVLDLLLRSLLQVRVKQVVIMSTVAIYPNPVGVDEETSIDQSQQSPYGRHRLTLERRLASHFSRVLAVRLPGLFGPGLKKNAIYDLLHGNELQKLNAASHYQYYNLERIWSDVSTAIEAGLDVVNFATEPVSIREVAAEAFGIDFDNDPGTVPIKFDVQSQHARLFGGRDGYILDRRQVLVQLREFVRRERISESSK